MSRNSFLLSFGNAQAGSLCTALSRLEIGAKPRGLVGRFAPCSAMQPIARRSCITDAVESSSRIGADIAETRRGAPKVSGILQVAADACSQRSSLRCGTPLYGIAPISPPEGPARMQGRAVGAANDQAIRNEVPF